MSIANAGSVKVVGIDNNLASRIVKPEIPEHYGAE
jgi:hypothetical protein